MSLLIALPTQLLADDDQRIVAPSADSDTRAALVKQWRALGPDYEPRTEHRFADGSPRYINRLVSEASPYLLQHAHNPVDWFPWGAEAFERARAEDKPVFLSIGYATCHWCHVMERESFEDETIAALMNEHFISIKVDREQLPDVDALFMTAVQMITGGGGWPMSSFLDDQARPFFGGTYFPPDRFTDLLQKVNEAWSVQRPNLLDEAARISAAIDSANQLAGQARDVGKEELTVARAQLLSRSDADGGGLGGAPKFPQESSLRFLLDQARRSGHAGTLDAALLAARSMVEGGIHDQIGGGFHRYATDRYWQVPHFEKMLYNQAGLGRVLAEAAWLTGDADLAEAARATFDYVLRDMRTPDGLFYSATDADSEGGEGAFFTWTPQTLLEALGDKDDAELAGLLWDIDGFGNFEGETIPSRAEPLADIARRLDMPVEQLRVQRAELADRLRIARNEREKPLRDEKILTGWNGLMIAALADASVLLSEPRYLEAARTAADTLWDSAHDDAAGGLQRVRFEDRTEVSARQTDYAWFADALLALHDADAVGQREHWLLRAALLADEMSERFLDVEGGGFFLGEADVAGTALVSRPKDLHDASTPSGNGVALQVLARLATRTGEPEYREQADALVVALSGLIGQRRGGLSAVLHGLADHLEGETGPVRTVARGKVRLSARPLPANAGRVELIAELAEGWHLNSAQPLQDYLIATQLNDADGEPLNGAAYPEPLVRTLAFQTQPLSLYEGQVVITADLPDTNDIGASVPIVVELQACDERVCLAPETVRFDVPRVAP